MKTPTAQRLCVKDIMITDPVTVDASTTARELARILADNGISGVPVVDGIDRVIGVVSKTDLLEWCVTGALGARGARGNSGEPWFEMLAEGAEEEVGFSPDELGTVEDFMSTEPVTASLNEPVSAVARRMAKLKVHRVIVVDDEGQLLGIVASLDLLKVFPG